ncbi:MAG TPA: NAD(P)-dependent oxidoreductase [Solirubrobacteraceae bacterium]|nr:NAD(P)-dependent oxidoreductase [Solirubrobacteraceae bacterium]
MRIFLAGATGVIGRRLTPLLLAGGHQVIGMTRSAQKSASLAAAGVEPVVADALDAAALRTALSSARADAVIHQLTSIPARIDPRRMKRDFELNDRLRSEGTRNLVAAAQAAGVSRIVAQSIAFAYAPGPPGAVHSERDPLFVDTRPPYQRSVLAVRDLEQAVLGASGVVLRYGYFYGPGSAISSTGSTVAELRRRRLPIVGGGAGVWSFVHIDDAARATVAALGHDGPAIYNVVDDEPAAVRDWIPALADATGAPKPMRVPALIARIAAGSFGVDTMTRSQGASNGLIKRELGWSPQHPSWRDGFRTALG